MPLFLIIELSHKMPLGFVYLFMYCWVSGLSRASWVRRRDWGLGTGDWGEEKGGAE